MEAIVQDSSRQFKVKKGDVVDVDLRGDPQPGDTVTFDKVCLIDGGEGGVKVGAPHVEGASVSATVVGLSRGPKLIVTRFRRRQNSRTRNGHRQHYLRVKIEDIKG